MQKSIAGNLYSASDLVNYAACPHLTHLDLLNLETPLPKAADTDEISRRSGVEAFALNRIKFLH